MELIYGAVGAVAVLLLFLTGALAGWKLREFVSRQVARQHAEALSEEEVREQQAQQAAFRQMQSYNVDMAYGYQPQDAVLGGDRA